VRNLIHRAIIPADRPRSLYSNVISTTTQPMRGPGSNANFGAAASGAKLSMVPNQSPCSALYAASRGISRSINRENRVSRVPVSFVWSSIAHKGLRLADYQRAAGPVTLLCDEKMRLLE
jgi:hypothetical protein